MLSLIFRIADWFLTKTGILKLRMVRILFWNLRAFDINKKWGKGTADFHTVKLNILKVGAKSILDFGCGSGRLFPLYQDLRIEQVVGQDISSNAISLAKEWYKDANYILLECEIFELNYPDQYFDLIISNRSLSAVPAQDIQRVIDKLCGLGKNIYINEFAASEKAPETSYWFKHDYGTNFRRNNFEIIEHGTIEETGQEWFLYGSNN